MPLIKTVPVEEAEGRLLELYKGAELFFGTVPNNVKMFGVSPAMLENQVQFAMYFMEHETLKPQLLTMIRLLVAHTTGSPYCTHLNTGLLVQQGFTSQQIEAAKADPDKSPLDEKDRALLVFVLRATSSPQSIEGKELDVLRGLGWNDRDIFDAVAHGARAAATNIVFDAFRLEDD